MRVLNHVRSGGVGAMVINVSHPETGMMHAVFVGIRKEIRFDAPDKKANRASIIFFDSANLRDHPEMSDYQESLLDLLQDYLEWYLVFGEDLAVKRPEDRGCNEKKQPPLSNQKKLSRDAQPFVPAAVKPVVNVSGKTKRVVRNYTAAMQEVRATTLPGIQEDDREAELVQGLTTVCLDDKADHQYDLADRMVTSLVGDNDDKTDHQYDLADRMVTSLVGDDEEDAEVAFFNDRAGRL